MKTMTSNRSELRRTIVRLLASGLATVSLIAGASAAYAEELPARADLNKRSLAKGLDKSSVALLRRLPGKGAVQAARALQTKFAAGSSFAIAGAGKETQDAKRFRIEGPQGAWSINIKGDGTAANVSRYDYLKTSPRVAPAQRLSAADLEKLGRQFIAKELSEFVKLDASDELVALKTQYQVESTGKGASTVREEVAAATIVFGRKHLGVDVVGAGSKVMVTFANDHQPVAFAYDWPEYVDTGRTQAILSPDLIWARSIALATMRFAATSVAVRRFECGYFDPGARFSKRDKNAPIQAACVAHYVGSQAPTQAGATGRDEAVGDPIPIGVTVEADAGWPHATAVRTFGDVSRQTAFGLADPGVRTP